MPPRPSSVPTRAVRSWRAFATIALLTALLALPARAAAQAGTWPAGAGALLRYDSSAVARVEGGPPALPPPPAAGTPRPQPLVFSISGGISLGSYQAGVNWGLLEFFRAASSAATATRLRMPQTLLGSIAGASAGNINTLLWAVEACTQRPAMPPDSSLFWQVWTSVGLPELLPDPAPDPRDRGLFDRTYFRDSLFKLIGDRMQSPALKACLIRTGITLTRIRPDTIRFDSLAIVTQRFATAFLSTVPTNATPPAFAFFWPTPSDLDTVALNRFGKLRLPVADMLHGRRVDFAQIFDVVQASSAFPLAFQPKRLTLVDPRTLARDTALYVDGGVFDNNPVGLALDLFVGSSLYRVMRANGQPDTVSVVYVNPDRLRGPLAELRATHAGPLAEGGLVAVTQMLGGSVATARQYELQLWARTARINDDTMPVKDTLIVRLSSRAHPVVGEHLGAFAAFLARPFREYDFHVGVYDAFDFIVREYACRGVADSSCVPRTMSALLASPPMALGHIAPVLLARLYEREYDAPRFAPFRDALARAPHSRLAAADSERLAVLLALFDAQATQYRAGMRTCGGPLPKVLLCRDGFAELLTAFAASRVVRDAAAHAKRDCERIAADRDRRCAEVRGFDALVRDPDRAASVVVDRLIAQLQENELQLRRDYAAGDPPRPGDAALPAMLVASLYRARPLRPRYGFEWSATSAPSHAWFPRYVLPYHIAANLGTSGMEAGIRPTWNVTRPVAVIVPLTAHTARVPSGGTTAWHTYLGGGLGVAARGLLPSPMGLLLPEFGATGQYLDPTGTGRGGLWMTEQYVDFSLLTGRLRLALRELPGRRALYDGHRVGVSAGLADFNGMAYWLYKLIAR